MRVPAFLELGVFKMLPNTGIKSKPMPLQEEKRDKVVREGLAKVSR